MSGLGWGVKLDAAKEYIDGVIFRAEQMGDDEVLEKVDEQIRGHLAETRAARNRLKAASKQSRKRGRRSRK